MYGDSSQDSSQEKRTHKVYDTIPNHIYKFYEYIISINLNTVFIN